MERLPPPLRGGLLLLGIMLLAGSWGCAAKAEPLPAGSPPVEEFAPLIPRGSGLFGSHEFRSTLRALPQWTRVMTQAAGQVEEMTRCNAAAQQCSTAALSWQKILGEARGLPAMEQLKAVNAYFNRWPYRLDIDVYGEDEYWAAPEEFLRLSGDCEDYSITKYYALKALGVEESRLRIVLLTDSIRGVAHAVLAVREGDENYVLDNLTDMVLPHGRYEHYLPQYSVNEHYRWAHVAPGLMR